MADKLLSVNAWTAFSKKRALDDDTLVKALAKLEKINDNRPEERLAALDELEAQLKKQVLAQSKLKPPKGDKAAEKAAKELKDKLDALMAEVEADRKRARAAKDAAAGADEEADSPVLLTTKMVPLLRELKKGETRMNALVCTSGKATALLIMRRSISPARRKLLAEYIDAKGGTKYIVGEVLFENKALTFVVQSQAGGLAKRLRQALLDQVEMRFKVKVRGEDGEDDDGEDDADGEDVEAAPGSEGAPATGTPTAPPKPATAEQLSYTQRLLKVRPSYDAALQAQHPESTKLRAVMGLAGEKAAAEDFAAATKALEMIEKLLAAPRTAPGETAGVDPGAAFTARLAALLPKVKEAAAAGTPAGTDIKLKASEAGVLARKREFDAAQSLLDEVENLLAGKAKAGGEAPPAGPSPRPSDDPLRAEYDTLRAKLQPLFDAAARTPKPPALAEQFQKVQQAWGLALEAADGGKLERALQILRRLDGGALAALLNATGARGGSRAEPDADADVAADDEVAGPDDATIDELALARAAAPPAGPSTVALTKARLAWDQARKTVHAELQRLEQVILDAVQDEPDADRIRTAAPDLYDVLDVLDESLLDVLDDLLNAEDAGRRFELRRQAAAKIDEYADYIASDPLVQSVDDNPFLKVKVRATLESTLAGLRSQLG